MNSSRDTGIQPPRRSQASGKFQKPSDKHPADSDSGHVFFVGPLNTGKTSTLKNLFHRRVSPQTTKNSTNELLEFGIGDLRILDTPGMASENDERDAQIIASLKKYMDQNLILRNCIPNVVVLVTKFNDPGIQAPQSAFVKTLRALNLLNRRLLSQEYCNLVVLLTHFMNMRRWVRENPNPQIQIVRDLVRKHLNTSCHVVCGENDCEGWGLPRMTSGHRLPTGDIYPGNLIDLILEVMHSSGFYTNLFLERGRMLNLINSFPLVSPQSSRCKRAFEALNWSNGILTITI